MGIASFLSMELKKKSGLYILAAITLSGIALFILGRYIQYNTNISYKDFLSSSLSGIGTLVTVSGVSGAVMKIFAVEGFFLDAVAEVSFGPDGLSRLSDEKLDEVWLHATRILFLGNMSSSTQQNKITEINDFRKELEGRLKSGLPSGEKHFVNKSSREIEITWHDRDNNIVQFHDVVHSELVPFDSTKPLEFEVRIRTMKQATLNDYHFEEKEPKILGPEEKLSFTSSVNEEKNMITTKYTSSPKGKHEIIRERICRLPIAKDPNWNSITPYIFRSMDVAIRNQAEGLTVIFSPLGSDDSFEKLQGDERVEYNQKVKFRLRKMLLPGEGYGITMVKTAS